MTFDEAMEEIAAEYPDVMAGVEIKLQRIRERLEKNVALQVVRKLVHKLKGEQCSL